MTNKKKRANIRMSSAIILAKLYKDGFFVMDEAKRTVEIDMRRSRIVKMYKGESYDDIILIMNRTAYGLDKAGYTVKKKYLDGIKDYAVTNDTD